MWGGYDASYHYGRRIDPALEDRRTTHRVLAEHFYETFPPGQRVSRVPLGPAYDA